MDLVCSITLNLKMPAWRGRVGGGRTGASSTSHSRQVCGRRGWPDSSTTLSELSWRRSSILDTGSDRCHSISSYMWSSIRSVMSAYDSVESISDMRTAPMLASGSHPRLSSHWRLSFFPNIPWSPLATRTIFPTGSLVANNVSPPSNDC